MKHICHSFILHKSNIELGMRTKKDIRDLLVTDELYRSAVKNVTPEDKKQIDSIIESLVIDVVYQLEQFTEEIKNDPEALSELARGLNGETVVIKGSEQAVTGSMSLYGNQNSKN